MKFIRYFLILIFVILNNSCYHAFYLFYDLKPSGVNEDVYLWRYEPFRENNILAVLPENSTFKINADLPVVDGATALYPLYASFIQAVYPEDKYSYYSPRGNVVLASGTRDAYRHLIDRRVDMIFCSKPSDEQLEMANQKGITLQLTPIGKEAFVFFVNRRNRVSNLTIDQIRGIYSGNITNWKELGGNNRGIKIYQRPRNSGSQTMLESIMGEYKIIEPLTEYVADGMGGHIRIALHRNYNTAIGYSFLFFATQMVQDNNLKLLSIDGVLPSRETIMNGNYPFAGDFYVITADSNNENINIFIEWILSEQGQYLVEKTGYIPIK